MLAIPFPSVDPVLVEIGPFAIRWYALAYVAGLLLGWRYLRRVVRRPGWTLTPDAVDDLLFNATLGVLVGGRLGYILVYQPGYYLAHPLDVFAVWQGGMAFHGGLIGAALAGWLFARRHGIAPLALADAMALATPAGLLLGRIANFVNAELWGRPTTLPWGVIFPGPAAQSCPWDWVGPCARHPTQLYEAGLEGLLLGVVLWALVLGRRALARPGLVTGAFLAGYGLARFTVEIWREADAQFVTPDNPLGHVLRLGEVGLQMGQLLSLPMILLGLGLGLWARRR